MFDISTAMTGYEGLVLFVILVLVWSLFVVSHELWASNRKLRYAAKVVSCVSSNIHPTNTMYEKVHNLDSLLMGKAGTVGGEKISLMPLDDVLSISKSGVKVEGDRTKEDAKLIKKLAKKEVNRRIKRSC